MKSFKQLAEEIKTKLDIKLPELSKPNLLNVGKRNANDQSKIAGKYKKGYGNTETSMITQRDREAGEAKGQVKKTLDVGLQNKTVVLDRNKFDELLNQSGDRTLNLDDGEEKSINSKTSQYTAQLLPDGRVKITKLSN